MIFQAITLKMGGGGLATCKMFMSNNEGGQEKLYFLEACLVFAPCGPNFQHLELFHSHQSSSVDLFLLLNFETYYCLFTFFLPTKISRIIQSPSRLCMHLIFCSSLTTFCKFY